MTTPNTSDDAATREAILAIGAWQKHLTDPTYNPDAGEARLHAQQKLARAALTSVAQTTAEVLNHAGAQITSTALDAMPTLDRPIMAHEITNPNYHTDHSIHTALTAAGCSRSQTMEFGWWHLLTLKLLTDHKLPDPPTYLLDINAPSQLPFDRTSLTTPHNQITPEERKGIDKAIRNLIRHSGGIWHRSSRWLYDAPLPAAWWRAEITHRAHRALTTPNVHSTQPEPSIKDVHAAFTGAWRPWADIAARSSTRLAAPNCAAAFALAALDHRHRAGTLPTGAAAKKIIANLMRRTQHLSVDLIKPRELALLAP